MGNSPRLTPYWGVDSALAKAESPPQIDAEYQQHSFRCFEGKKGFGPHWWRVDPYFITRLAMFFNGHILHVAIIKIGDLPLFDHPTIAGKDS
jgi:hypothetical protein